MVVISLGTELREGIALKGKTEISVELEDTVSVFQKGVRNERAGGQRDLALRRQPTG